MSAPIGMSYKTERKLGLSGNTKAGTCKTLSKSELQAFAEARGLKVAL